MAYELHKNAGSQGSFIYERAKNLESCLHKGDQFHNLSISDRNGLLRLYKDDNSVHLNGRS